MTALLEVRDLTVQFGAAPAALRDFSLRVDRGECAALVGDSGSGKTTAANACLGLLPEPGRIVSGSIRFEGRELVGLSDREWGALRGTGMAMLFQEPAAALDPVMRVGRQVTEALEIRGLARGAAARARAVESLAAVGLPRPEHLLSEVPHRLSGGMRQRVAIAAAIAARPKLLFADEPTTALDPTLRLLVLDLLDRMRREEGLAVVLISHDRTTVSRCAGSVTELRRCAP